MILPGVDSMDDEGGRGMDVEGYEKGSKERREKVAGGSSLVEERALKGLEERGEEAMGASYFRMGSYEEGRLGTTERGAWQKRMGRFNGLIKVVFFLFDRFPLGFRPIIFSFN